MSASPSWKQQRVKRVAWVLAGMLTARVPDGYADDFQASALFFPSGGCWEIEGQAEDSYLRFVVYVQP